MAVDTWIWGNFHQPLEGAIILNNPSNPVKKPRKVKTPEEKQAAREQRARNQEELLERERSIPVPYTDINWDE